MNNAYFGNNTGVTSATSPTWEMNPAKDYAIISDVKNYLRSDGERDTNICPSDIVIFTSVQLIFELILILHDVYIQI